MYGFILAICLIIAPDQCVTLVEDPPLYYETAEECEKNMVAKSINLAEMVLKDKTTELYGRCVHYPNIKAT
jgi:hypothetical protein